MQNIHLTFDGYYIGYKSGGDFEKFCGLLRIYELYKYVFPYFISQQFLQSIGMQYRIPYTFVFPWLKNDGESSLTLV